MRTTRFRSFVGATGLSVIIAAGAFAQMPKYGVTATAEKNVDFAKFTTYTWTPGQPSANKTIDSQIVAAVDRELAALGMSKATSGSGDVLATYYSLSRTDVNLKAKPDSKGVRPEYPVGTLVVALLNPADRRRLLRLRVDQPIDLAPDKLEASINGAVAALFTKYPTRQKK
jgi:Domain of unknown function (DUF4136)